jgi:uroporphyrinogen decarboxylase
MVMTSKEVTNCLLHRTKCDRIGLYENIWPDTLQRWKQEGYPDNELPEHYFHFDINRIGAAFDTAPFPNVHNIIQETDDWQIYQNGAGATIRVWKKKSGTPEHIGFSITDSDIWEQKYKKPLESVDLSRFSLEPAKQKMNLYQKENRWVAYNSCFIWETMRQSLGDICMYESLALDPDWIHDFNRVYTNFFIEHYKVLFHEVGVPDGIWLSEDLGYKNGLFCSVDMLNELFVPYYQQIVDFFHSYNIPVILHSCGNIEKALPLIVKIGFDALHPMERKAGCDPLKFAEKYGDQLTFIGGLDARILENGDKGEIKKEVTNLIRGMKNLGASYFFASDHSLSTLVSFESYQYALEIYRENQWY